MSRADSWPLWERAPFQDVARHRNARVPQRRARAAETYAKLAGYAHADALQSFAFVELDPELSDDELAAGIYRTLKLEKWTKVWEASGDVSTRTGYYRQQIRSPRACQSSKAATCIDAAVLVAALGVRTHCRPVIAVAERHAPGAANHAMVLFVPAGATELGDDTPVNGVTTANHKLSQRLDHDIVAFDPSDALVSTSEEPHEFESSRRRASAFLTDAVRHGRTVVLVDVVTCLLPAAERARYVPLPDAYLPRHVPDFGRVIELFEGQKASVEALADRRGTIVLHGKSGVGKTTSALQAARSHPASAVIVVDGSSLSAIQASFARIAASERGIAPGALDATDVKGYAAIIPELLADTSSPWCLVVDNADGDPEQIERFLPTPNPEHEQLVLITTTNGDWRLVVGDERTMELDGISSSEIATRLEEVVPDAVTREALSGLIGGAAVTLTAFLAFALNAPPELRTSRIDALLSASDATTHGKALRGVAALATAVIALSPEVEPVLRRLAWLPPDRVPLTPEIGTADEFRLLAGYGIVRIPDGADHGRVHRLTLAGVRAALSARADPERERAAFDAVLRSPSAITALEAEADREHLESIADATSREDSPLLPADADPAAVGTWLAKAAALLEFGGNNERATALAAAAVDRFRTLEDPRAIAARSFGAALILKARGAYRNSQSTQRAYEVSAADTREAVEIFLAAGEPDRAGQARRVNALIRSKLATHAPADRVVPLTEDAYEDLRREAALIADRLDLRDEAMRAQYNVAAVAIAVARRSRDQVQARNYLLEARKSYRAVGDARRAHYGGGHGILVAPCDAGEAFTYYLEAQRFEADPAVRQAHLARATELEVRALAARFKAEGRLGGGDTAKSSRQLTKIAHARELLNDSLMTARPVAFDEVYGRDAAVPRLTAKNDLERFLADWLGHPSLRQVAGLDPNGDGDGPADSARLLLALRDATGRDLAGLAGRRHSAAVGQTARTLGLVDDLMPTRRAYDAAIVLPDRTEDDPVEAAFKRAVDGGELIATRVAVELADEQEIEATLVDALQRLVASDESSTVLIVCSRLRRVRLLALGRATFPGVVIDGLGVQARKETEAERLEEIVQTATRFRSLLDADPDVGGPVAATPA